VKPKPQKENPGGGNVPLAGGPGGVDVVQDDQDNPDVPDELV
jgi:hypothetical protein